MRIEHKDNIRICMLSEVCRGDVIKEGDDYYIVCNDTGNFNCVNLETGIVDYINRDAKVEIVQGKFIIDK